MTVVGYISLTLILLAEGLLQWKYVGTDDKAGNAACVLFIFLYIIFFQVSFRCDLHEFYIPQLTRLQVCGCSGIHLDCRSISNSPASQRRESRHLCSLRRNHHLLNPSPGCFLDHVSHTTTLH